MENNHTNGVGKASNREKRVTDRTILWIASIPFLITSALAGLYYSRFAICTTDAPAPNTTFSGKEFSCLYSLTKEEWGQAGDFIGGIANPIIGLITILLVIISIRQNQTALQQNQAALAQNEQALRDSKEELKISNIALNDQKDLMAAEYRERCFASLLTSIQLSLDKKVSEEPRALTVRAAVSHTFDNMNWSHIGSIPTDSLYPSLALAFEKHMQYINGMSCIYRMEQHETGKDMLCLRLLSGTSNDYLFMFGIYLAHQLKKNLQKYNEIVNEINQQQQSSDDYLQQVTNSFLGFETMYLEMLTMLVDTTRLSTQVGLSERLEAEIEHYNRSR